MRTPLVMLLFLAIGAAGAIHAQISNPIPAPVVKRGLTVEIRDLVRLPETRGLRPADEDVVPAGWARVSYVRDLPDGRRFANDSRGLLYLLDRNNQPSVYANVGAAFPLAVYNRLESGFIGFDFHPEFARNGLFYTVHGERATGNPVAPHFIPPGFTQADATYHNVITEWRAAQPAANTFEGTRRELLRVAHVVANLTHPFGHVEFNPTSKPGAPDYGLLYTSGSDLGFSNGGGPKALNPSQTQRLDTVIGAILRIDPRSPSVSGGMKGLGDYTIPPTNTFAADGDPKTLGEIYAYGFRNAHRLSWDLTDGTMFASDIGMNHIEEINIVHNGGNYGWMKREGPFENGVTRPGGALSQLFPLPAEVLDGRTKDGFTYPVAMYDHNDGQSVTGGFAYHGRIPALRGPAPQPQPRRGALHDVEAGRHDPHARSRFKRHGDVGRPPMRIPHTKSMPTTTSRRRATSREKRVPRTYRLPLAKLSVAKRALGAATATETIERALDLVVFQRELIDGTRGMHGIQITPPDPEQ
jgi:hypothetical protein